MLTDFLGVCLESTFWCLIYCGLFFNYCLLYLLCIFYIFCIVILSFHLILSAFSFWHFSVERKAWKPMCPSRPLKLIISRIAVSCHRIFKSESLKSSICCFLSTLPANLYLLRARCFYCGTILKPRPLPAKKKKLFKATEFTICSTNQTKPQNKLFFKNLIIFISILLNNIRKKP